MPFGASPSVISCIPKREWESVRLSFHLLKKNVMQLCCDSHCILHPHDWTDDPSRSPNTLLDALNVMMLEIAWNCFRLIFLYCDWVCILISLSLNCLVSHRLWRRHHDDHGRLFVLYHHCSHAVRKDDECTETMTKFSWSDTLLFECVTQFSRIRKRVNGCNSPLALRRLFLLSVYHHHDTISFQERTHAEGSFGSHKG